MILLVSIGVAIVLLAILIYAIPLRVSVKGKKHDLGDKCVYWNHWYYVHKGIVTLASHSLPISYFPFCLLIF